MLALLPRTGRDLWTVDRPSARPAPTRAVTRCRAVGGVLRGNTHSLELGGTRDMHRAVLGHAGGFPHDRARPAIGERRVSTYAGSRARIRCPPAPNRRARQRLRRPLPVPTSGDWLATWLSGKDRATGSGHNACFGKLVRRSDGDRAPRGGRFDVCVRRAFVTYTQRTPTPPVFPTATHAQVISVTLADRMGPWPATSSGLLRRCGQAGRGLGSSARVVHARRGRSPHW